MPTLPDDVLKQFEAAHARMTGMTNKTVTLPGGGVRHVVEQQGDELAVLFKVVKALVDVATK